MSRRVEIRIGPVFRHVHKTCTQSYAWDKSCPKCKKKKESWANVTDLFWSRTPNTRNQNNTHTLCVFYAMFKSMKLLLTWHYHHVQMLAFLMIWKHWAKLLQTATHSSAKWELKCYRQLEESLEFPWNEVLNETWSDWQVCSLSHWAPLSSCSPSCRGERYTRLFYQIKSQCM